MEREISENPFRGLFSDKVYYDKTMEYLYGLLNIAYDMIFPCPGYLECAVP